ncbi:MAG: TetR/AcrR family transcriptional regulator [Methylococcales bacterium]|nr:TetR/AcrR family transcriptional regulator [Methylococcales bacterium]MDD5754866.1 TetR/AcrR family transcriptional regulator [Methylococcales bacterium]
MTESIETPDTKRQAIMQAATRLFLTNNYRSVSMDKIAQAAPVSKATLYNYFDSKTALLMAIVAQLCTSLLQTITQTLSTADGVEQTLQKIARAFVELLYSSDGLAIYRLVIAESHEFPELGQMVYDNGAKLALSQLEIYLQQLHDSGRFDIPDAYFAADAFFSLLKSDLHCRCLLSVQPPPNEFEKTQLIESATAFYLRGIGYATN